MGAGAVPDADAGAVRAFENLPAVAWLLEGPDLVVAAANRAARASVGDRPGILGRPVREVVPELAGQAIFDMIGRCLAENRVVVGDERRVLVDLDGDGTLEERFYSFSMTPLPGPDGGVREVLAHVLDVTAQVRARQQVEARYLEVRDVVLALQRSLLPDALPALPGVDLSARYVVAGAEAAAGGDWFDAITGSGQVTLVVGDVVGHGPAAAATMGGLRTLCGHALARGQDVASALAELDAFAERTPAARGATVCAVQMDTVSGAITVASRGHVPALVVGAGRTRFLPGGGKPLGTGQAEAVRHEDVLAPDESLLLFTDGLVERADQPLSHRLDTLARVAAAVAGERTEPGATLPAALADRLGLLVLERMGWLGFHDDVTVLVAHRRPAVADLRLVLPAAPASVTAARRACGQWLAELGADEDSRFRAQHAVTEAVTNAVDHAYLDVAGEIEVHAHLDDHGTAEFRVADRGRWRAADADPAGRGRGLAMMRALSDRLDLIRSPAGTTAVLRTAVRKPAAVGEAPAVAPTTPPPDRLRTEVERTANPRLAVAGPVDTTTVAELRATVLDAARGGALPLTVDLTEVTHLASAGVTLLHELTGRIDLSLHAPPGTPAHDIIALTGLD